MTPQNVTHGNRTDPAVRLAARGTIGPFSRTAGDLTDTELIVAMRGGDERAFASLVDRHHAALVRSAQKFVRDPAAAEDVVQDTWMGFLESLDRFEGRCSIHTWLLRILFNKASCAHLL